MDRIATLAMTMEPLPSGEPSCEMAAEQAEAGGHGGPYEMRERLRMGIAT